MSYALKVKLEKALIAYIAASHQESGDPLHGFTLYEGHGDQTRDAEYQLTITALSTGGPFRHQGNYEIPVSLLLLVPGDKLAALQSAESALLAIFGLGNLAAIQTALNAPAVGDDERTVQGFGLTGLEIDASATEEGRDEERHLHGVRLSMIVDCHLEADPV